MQPFGQRTAVLVVHGMGLQRPLETVRGIVRAVCATEPKAQENEVWLHPDRSAVDIDLPVISSEIREAKPKREVDFYELYWAHLMSETPAFAVLLWLFELAQKGPRLERNMKLIWDVATLFLVLMIFSVSLLLLKMIEQLANVKPESHAIVFAPILMFLIFFTLSAAVFAWNAVWRFSLYSAIAIVGLTVFAVFFLFLHVIVGQPFPKLASEILPTLVALLAVYLLMGKWGFRIGLVALLLSLLFECLVRLSKYFGHLFEFKLQSPMDWLRSVQMLGGWLPSKAKDLTEPVWTTSWISPEVFPWSLTSSWCVAAACVILATYVVISLSFLQPYLGDAARYLRNAPSNVAVRREIRREAVNMLERLHKSGRYDRIVVVAHSLGTVIAYDMLRAYFSRIAPHLPTAEGGLAEDIKAAEDKIVQFQKDWWDFQEKEKEKEKKKEQEKPSPEELRRFGRKIVDRIAAVSAIDKEQEAWLVTDFVTLGSPLTHARYLMCDGKTAQEFDDDFDRRVNEGEFPVCPPATLDKEGHRLNSKKTDGPLTYAQDDGPEQARRFHNNALFGLTRWTNLYFRVSELFRGDAIGGSLEEIFGGGIIDVALPGHTPQDRGVTAHIRYWDVPGKGDPLQSTHIKELRRAIDLADEGLANALNAQVAPATPAQNVAVESTSHAKPGEFASPV